jgi:predicted enzyme related to lactoylglutathione lyase
MKLRYALIYVNDVNETMKFYAKAFGLKRGFLHDSLQYGEMMTGETKLGFVDHETAKSVSPPTQKPWGQTVSYVRDNNGFLIEICSEI